MKISFIATVYNEESTIDDLMQSILKQSKVPDEILITDGGSKDNTVKELQKYSTGEKHKKPIIKIFIKKGNRAIGRNESIRNATGDIIACADSGNIIDKDWVKNITRPFESTSPQPSPNRRGSNSLDVVAGYYQGMAQNVFQKCVIPYALVMPEKVDPDNFLPATRSVAFTKKIWQQIGGFPEQYTHNEDYVFARRLRKAGAHMVFAKDAIVYWMPRNTFRQAFVMMYRFAYGDAQARIFRPKVIFVFIRYFIFLTLALLFLLNVIPLILYTLFFILLLYTAWAVWKNYKYVNEWQALYLLPAMQFTADWAVLKGTVLGLLNKEIKY